MRAVIAIIMLCLVFMGIKYVRENVPIPGEATPPDAPAVVATKVPAAPAVATPVVIELPEARATDKPACRDARRAIEAAGRLTFEHESPHGSSAFYETVDGMEPVLTCINDPDLSIGLPGWQRSRERKGPARRLTDLFVEQGAISARLPPAKLRVMATRCYAQALADSDGLGEIRDGPVEVDCHLLKHIDSAAKITVSRRSAP